MATAAFRIPRLMIVRQFTDASDIVTVRGEMFCEEGFMEWIQILHLYS
ncbi:MAG: hypothetical protein P8X57_11870 [Cyclobacteriaceae bacterium]